MSVFFMDFDMAPSVIWARDLYDQMQIRSDFRKWFPRMCQYGFVEGRDYEFVPRVRPQDEGGRTVQRYVKDYRITLEMAKQLYKLHHFHKNDCFRSCEGQHCMGTNHWMQAVIELLHQHKCKSHAPPKRFYESQPPDSLVTTTQIAKEYGCGAKVFNRLLHLHGIQYRANNQWVLYAKHQDKGYEENTTIMPPEKQIVQDDRDARAEELESAFSYDGYQVVRKELFAHLRDPAIVIRKDSITFNTACITGLEDVVYVHVMFNNDLKRIVVRGCDENDKDALRWCVAKPDKRKSRKMSCKPFATLVYQKMGWDSECRYKMLGYRITFEGETLYVFDLLVPEIFHEGQRKKNAVDSQDNAASTKPVNSRKGFYLDDIVGTFGVPVEEHRKESEVKQMDGYVSMGILTGKIAPEAGKD